jgi:hypothetical protein
MRNIDSSSAKRRFFSAAKVAPLDSIIARFGCGETFSHSLGGKRT